jgi:hypothetical protein
VGVVCGCVAVRGCAWSCGTVCGDRAGEAEVLCVAVCVTVRGRVELCVAIVPERRREACGVVCGCV